MTNNHVVLFKNDFKIPIYLSTGNELTEDLKVIEESMREGLQSITFHSFDTNGQEHLWIAQTIEVMAVVPMAFYPEK